MKHTVITGHYGTGKTNIAVNLALNAAKNSQKKIFLIDADIVNPYFRSADNEDILRAAGVTLIAPMSANTNIDIPAMPATILRVFNIDCEVIWDIGGDDAGAVILGRYAEDIQKQGYEMLYTINLYRPMMSSAEEISENIRLTEAASRLKVHALIDNSNLGSETTAADIVFVKQQAGEISALTGLPIKFRSVNEKLRSFFPSDFHIKIVTKTLW